MTISKTLPSRPEYAGVLPADFLHGYAYVNPTLACIVANNRTRSAAYQVEGATSKGGRGPSNWDEMLKDYPDNGDDACRSYDLWKDDVQLLKQFGAKSYRFSVSWPRIKPLGKSMTPWLKKARNFNLVIAILTCTRHQGLTRQ